MNRGPITQASKNPLDHSISDVPIKQQTGNSKDLMMTPQRKDQTLRKLILDVRLSKTENDKKSMSPDARIKENLNFKSILFTSSIQKENKYTGCNCRKSQCLKMYCTCFAEGKMCDETCLCDSCKNGHDNMDRSEAINQIIEKDPFAFSKKSDSANLTFQDDFCNCRKSNCTKKYCDCYRRGRQCGSKCNCLDCNNCINHLQQEKSSDSDLKKKVKIE